MTESPAQLFLDAAHETFRAQKSTGERALAQLSTQQLHQTPTHDANSPAVIVKHLNGNMRSRWTDFLTSDGEKPDRQRDDEFIDDGADKDEVLRRFKEGWSLVLDTIESLTPEDLARTITIRGQPHSVPRAILRQIDHYGYHTGQIVLLCKHIVGDGWQTLTVPRGGTTAFNASLGYDAKA